MSKYFGSSFGKHWIQIRWFCCHLWAMLHFWAIHTISKNSRQMVFFFSDFFEPPKFPVMQFPTLVDIGLMLPFVYESGNLPKWSLRLKPFITFITNSLRLIDLILPGKYMMHNAWNHGDQNRLQIFSKSLHPGKFHMYTKKDALESYLLSDNVYFGYQR